MNNVFSDNFKKFRHQKNYTQEQVADILGVSTHTISRWERNATLPDITFLPEISKLYGVTIDDLFKVNAVAYENYAQRLSSVYEETRNPEDFIRADIEFKKLIKKGEYSTEDLRCYGILHHHMMQYSINKAIDLFDEVIEKGEAVNSVVFWSTKRQKMSLYSQIGRNQENIDSALKIIEGDRENVQDWICLIAAYRYSGNDQEAYEWFLKAVCKFPKEACLYIYGGDACEKLCRYSEALQYWDKAIEIDNTLLEPKYSKLNYYAKIGQKDKCEELSWQIVEELKRSGLDIEAKGEEKRLNSLINGI